MLPIIAAAKQTPGAISEVQRVQQINKKNPLSPLIYNPHLQPDSDVLRMNSNNSMAERKIKQKQMLSKMKHSNKSTAAMAYKSPHPMINKDSKIRHSEQQRKAKVLKAELTDRSTSSRKDSKERNSQLSNHKNNANLDKLKVKFTRKNHPGLVQEQEKVSKDLSVQYGVSQDYKARNDCLEDEQIMGK